MEIIRGTSAFPAIAIGRIAVYKREERQLKEKYTEDVPRELQRFYTAKAESVRQLRQLYETALEKVGESNAMIFEVHGMMLDDTDFQESVLHMIQAQKFNAEYAVMATGEKFADLLASMEDVYIRERAADVKDISQRLIRNLEQAAETENRYEEPVILVAEDLAPSETVQLEKDKVLAFVTKEGSANSHTAILARTMNLPAVIHTGTELGTEWDGKMAVVDGINGVVYLDPTAELIQEMQKKQREENRKRALLQELKGKEDITLDGRKVKVHTNIGSVRDIASVLANDASGIGLFRSEFLYLEKKDYPTEDELFLAYKTVLEQMEGKPVIIRTLDIGADKQIDYFKLGKEANPAMGYRAIRICLDRQEIFRTQLRALYRASALGNLSIMFPMIVSLEEVRKIKEIVECVKSRLREEGVQLGQVDLGIMIETPAAALLSGELAREVDFFSIGTNDLTQYTLAVDRQNPRLEKIYDPRHPAVLALIRQVIENAHKEGIWVGICGEAASDLELTDTFLKLGVDELSVPPAFVLGLRKKIRETDTGKACFVV